MKYLLSCTLVLICLVSCKQKNAIEDAIKLNLQKGKTYQLAVETRVISTQYVLEEYTTQVMDLNYEVDFEVRDYKEGHYLLSVRYTKLATGFQTETDTIYIRSEDDTEAALFYRKLIKYDFQLKVTPNGIVHDVIGIDNIIKAIVDEYKNLNYLQREQLYRQYNTAFGKESTMGNMQMLFAFYPKGEILKDKSWKSKVTFSSALPMKFENTYQLIFENAQSYGIEGKSDFAFEPNDEAEVAGIKIKLDAKGSLYSKITIGKEDGWIEKIDQEQWVEGHLLNYNDELRSYL